MSSALRFANLSNFHVQGGDYTTEILEAIGEIEQQKTFSCEDVINILKGFQIYKENKPSAALVLQVEVRLAQRAVCAGRGLRRGLRRPGSTTERHAARRWHSRGQK
jgi:hypothetical protein